MKFSLSILTLFVSCSLLAQKAQYVTDYEAQYEVQFKLDSTELEEVKTEILYLYTGKESGVFMSYPEAHKEEIEENIKRQMKTGQIKLDKNMSSHFKTVFYKDLQTHEVYSVGKIEKKKYVYKEPELPLEWKMEAENREVMGYTAQKATTHFAGRDYIAWFTLEVPITDGPYVFMGLPGLIVELYDTQDHYHFTLKSLDQLDESKTFEIPETETIEKAKFVKDKASYDDKMADQIFADVGGIQMQIYVDGDTSPADKMDTQEIKRKMKKNKERQNNPIELE